MQAIIFVEDAKSRDDIRMALNMCLPGLELLFIDDSKRCIKIVHNSNPDIIILDNSFSDMDGYKLITKIRSLSFAPILTLSWVKDEADMLKSIECGADAYCTKPIKQLEFVAHVRALLCRSKVGLAGN